MKEKERCKKGGHHIGVDWDRILVGGRWIWMGRCSKCKEPLESDKTPIPVKTNIPRGVLPV